MAYVKTTRAERRVRMRAQLPDALHVTHPHYRRIRKLYKHVARHPDDAEAKQLLASLHPDTRHVKVPMFALRLPTKLEMMAYKATKGK